MSAAAAPSNGARGNAAPPGAPRAAGAAAAAAADSAAQKAPAGRSRMYPDEPRVGVGVVCFREPTAGANPEVLLVRRAKEPAKGLWCFPGGSLELGESLAECGARRGRAGAGLKHAWRRQGCQSGCARAPRLPHAHPPPARRLLGTKTPPAVRELQEEAGVDLVCDPVDTQGFSKGLRRPTAFAAVDSIVRDAAPGSGDTPGSSSSGGGGGGSGSSGGAGALVRFHYVVVEVGGRGRRQGAKQEAGRSRRRSAAQAPGCQCGGCVPSAPPPP
jgi:8-oxo-dGTP pyrophosphatase MutT (NUDIX family)